MLGSKTSPGHATRIRSLRWTAGVCGAALALAAYGVGSTPASAKTSKPTVAIATVGGMGSILVDAQGRTLYTFTNDGQAVPCTGACAAAWPPLVVKAGSKPVRGHGVNALGTKGRQVTQHKLPLYRYAGDSKAGEANGEGIDSFGGIWHVVKATGGDAATSTPIMAPRTTSGSSGSGY